MVVHRHRGVAAVSQAAAAEHVGAYRAAKQVHLRIVHIGRTHTVGGHQVGAQQVGLLVAGRRQVAQLPYHDTVFGAHHRGLILVVVVAVTAAIDMVHIAAAHVHSRVAVHVAAHVVAAVQVVHTGLVGVADVHIGHARHVGHAAAAEEASAHMRLVILHLHIRRHPLYDVAAHILHRLKVVHVAGIAAAVHVLHRSLLQPHERHAVVHRVAVVAAEDGAHKQAVPRSVNGIVFLCVVEQHHHFLAHSHAVAAAKHGIDKAAARMHVDEGRRLEGAVVNALILAHRLHRAVLRTRAVVVVGSVAAAVHVGDARRAFQTHIGAI